MPPWAAYTPSAAAPWSPKLAGHLLRRAGFGPTAAELDRAVSDGPDATVSRLLDGGPESDSFAATSDYLASEKALPKGSTAAQLGAWWVARLLNSPHPLREKLALFWHNHFATSLAKVRDARFMLGQYRLFYAHALGDFSALLKAMTTDPAMAVWLDTVGSVKGKPNENYARELMELFSLGIGPYTEADVREAARAFTGYELKNGAVTLNPNRHDRGRKTVMGKAGDWGPADVVGMCLGHPACPRFVARKLYRAFVSDTTEPAPELLAGLAAAFKGSGYSTRAAVELILRSEHFYSPASYRRKVKSPVEFAVGAARALEGTPGPLPLAEALDNLGQALFAPPSVKGWDGGAAWLTGQTLLARQNLALALVSGEDARFGRRCDPAKVVGTRRGAAAVDKLLAVLVQNDVPAATRDRLAGYAAKSPKPQAVAHLVLSLPEYQLN